MPNQIQLKDPDDVKRMVCRVIRTIQKAGDDELIVNAGKISQLLGQFLKAYEMKKLEDIEKRLKVLEAQNALRQSK